MVMFVPEVRQTVSPGSPDPISFGMNKDPSQSMSNMPGTGSIGAIGGTFGGGGGMAGGVQPQYGGGAGGGIPSSWQPNTSLSVTNLAPVNVNAATLSGPSLSGGSGFYGGSTGSYGHVSSPGVNVKDLAPVHVTAQTPVQPTFLDQAWMWKNDHPVLGNLAQGVIGNIPILGQVSVLANAYENYKHGKGLLNDLTNFFGHSTGGGSQPSPGSPLSSNQQNPLYKDLYDGFFDGSGYGGATYGGTPPSNGSQLPNYPGLASSPVLASSPGGYWNQKAIIDAALPYGPFSNFKG